MLSGFDIIIIFYGYGLIEVTVTVTVTVMSGISMECPWKFRKTRHTAKKYPGASIVAAPGVILSNALDRVLVEEILQCLALAGVVIFHQQSVELLHVAVSDREETNAGGD